jgi:hypothetical protein
MSQLWFMISRVVLACSKRRGGAATFHGYGVSATVNHGSHIGSCCLKALHCTKAYYPAKTFEKSEIIKEQHASIKGS